MNALLKVGTGFTTGDAQGGKIGHKSTIYIRLCAFKGVNLPAFARTIFSIKL
jgi:hypothetical protein